MAKQWSFGFSQRSGPQWKVEWEENVALQLARLREQKAPPHTRCSSSFLATEMCLASVLPKCFLCYTVASSKLSLIEQYGTLEAEALVRW